MDPKELFNGFDLEVMDASMRKMIVHSLLGESESLKDLLVIDPGLAKSFWGYFTPLDFAVRSGNAASVKLLLEHGAEVIKNPIGWTDDPLTKAKDRGYGEIAALLEQHLSQKYKFSPAGNNLANRIKQGETEGVLREMDQSPQAIHASDDRGNTPLHWAVLTRNLPLIDGLILRGADMGAQRVDGATPLQVAIDGDYWFRTHRDLNPKALSKEWFLIGYLVSRGADYDIWTAAAVGDTEQVEALVQEDPLLVQAKNSIGKRPLSYAAQYGNATAVKQLLLAGADPNAEEREASSGSALWHAVKGGYEDCVRLLLEHGANPNAMMESGGNCLCVAMSSGHQKLADLLYTYGASMNLDTACYLGRLDLAGEILAANPSLVNSGGDFGPLCMAAGFGHMDLVKLLLRYEVNLNAPWYTNNYLGYAMNRGAEMVRFLLESGADPNNANWLGVTYLHKAAWMGNVNLAELLLEFGSNINAIEEEYNSTPLGWAAKYGRTEMVQFLLSKGANPSLPIEPTWATPLSWAKQKGNLAIGNEIERAMGN